MNNAIKEIFKVLFVIFIFTAFIGCSQNSDEKAFRDWLVADFENVLICEGNIYTSYNQALNALEEYSTNPNEETKNKFVASVNKHKEILKNNLHPKSNVKEDTYGIMEKYDIPLEDYIWFVNENYAETRGEYDNLDNAVSLVELNDAKGAKRELDILRAWYDYSRKYMVYSTMDMTAKSGDNNIEYFKSVVKKYINIDDIQWLNDREEILKATERADSEFSEKLSKYQLELNNAENEALKASK